MRSALTDRETYVRAHRTYDDLHELLGSLSNKLSDVSSNVDKEFLAAYRVHMLSIQSEIKELTDEVNRGVQALNSDGDVAKLEKEVNWFIEESTRLRVHYTSMEKDYQQMLSRLKAMNEQRVYLNEQLKAIMKRNRVLQAEIDYAKQFEALMQKDEGRAGHAEGNAFDSPYGQEIAFYNEGGDGGDVGSESLWEVEEEDADEDHVSVGDEAQQPVRGDTDDDDLIDGDYAQTPAGYQTGNNSRHSRISRPYQEVLVHNADTTMPTAASNFVPPPRKIVSRGGGSRGGGSRGGGSRGGGSRGSESKKALLLGTSSGNFDKMSSSDSASGSLALQVAQEDVCESSAVADMGSLGSPSSRERLSTPAAEAVVLGRAGVAHQRINSARYQASVTAGGGSVGSYSSPSAAAEDNYKGRASSPLQQRTQWGGQEGYIPTPVYRKAESSPMQKQIQGNQSPHSKQQALQSEQRRGKAKKLNATSTSYNNTNASKERKKLSRRNRTKLAEFLRQKCPLEVQLEKAAADTFLEIRSRKLHAAKRGSIKRYPVSVTGAIPIPADGNRPVQDADAIAAAVSTAAAVMGTGGGALAAGMDDEVDALLGVPLIQATGGISGMGLHQFADNDKLSTVVKFLLKREVFRQVVVKLQETL